MPTDLPPAPRQQEEEPVRLLSGFNDLFVVIASLLFLFALGLLAIDFAPKQAGKYLWFTRAMTGASLAILAGAWAIGEWFVRRHRLAMTGVLVTLVILAMAALLPACVALLWPGLVDPAIDLPFRCLKPQGECQPPASPLFLSLLAGAAVTTALAARCCWRRFRVPIAIALGCLLPFMLLCGLLQLRYPALADRIGLPLLYAAAGLVLFVQGLRWDRADPARRSYRADVAFWLHAAAAPLMLHPLFSLAAGWRPLAGASLILPLFALATLLSLLLDRRVFMLSGLAYFLYALLALLKVSLPQASGLPLTALISGGGMLLLSAFWQPCRHALFRHLPHRLVAWIGQAASRTG